MTKYHYRIDRLGNLVLADDLKPGEVEIDPITPAQLRKMHKAMIAQIDLAVQRALYGPDTEVPANVATTSGITIEHAPPKRKLLKGPHT